MADTETTGTTEDSETEELTLEEELIEDLTVELSDDKLFNATLLKSKVKNAIREVTRVRNYPSYYTDEQKSDDVYNYYTNIRAIALYDYNTIGIEGQTSSSENSTSRSYVDRNTYFAGVIPLARN